jgi:hypothetical protein
VDAEHRRHWRQGTWRCDRLSQHGQFEGADAVVSVPFKVVRRGDDTITVGGVPASPPWLPDPFVLNVEAR